MADDDNILCGNCEEARIALRCVQCQAAYCRACGEVLHKSALRKSHTLVPMNTGEPVEEDDENIGCYSESEDETEPSGGVTRSVCIWSASDVAAWMRSLPAPCCDYADLMKQHHIRGRILAVLTAASLERMGVPAPHRAALIEAIARLQIESHVAALRVLGANPPRAKIVAARS
eukprot:m.25267 g.25267  ORF g.25267 m.25267 type:complete len:174 (+) comp4140_c0_seq1:121-642(+)